MRMYLLILLYLSLHQIEGNSCGTSSTTAEHIIIHQKLLIDLLQEVGKVKQQNQDLKKNYQDLMERVAKLSAAPEAFAAYVNGNKQAFKPGDKVQFPVISYNTGSFNSVTNQFVCIRGGIYVFFVTLISETSLSWIRANIVKDEHVIMPVYTRWTTTQNTEDAGTASVITNCSAGQLVWVQFDRGSGRIDQRGSSFVGFRLA